jgi:DNA-binding response OmpR family regulator
LWATAGDDAFIGSSHTANTAETASAYRAGMDSPAPATGSTATDPLCAVRLGEQERAVLTVLIRHLGRVVSRRELARHAGLAALSERRCDSLLVSIRRQLPAGAILTVRSRGWMLHRWSEMHALDLIRQR